MDKGKQVSVYIRAEDMPVWQRAERHAKARRLTMSALVLTALEHYLADNDDSTDRR